MAKITFEQGDIFVSDQDDVVGVVVGDNFAVLITGIGGRTGYTVTVGALPADALPSGLEKLDFSVQMAIHGAMAAMSIGVKPQPVHEDEWLIQFEFEGEKYTLPMDATYAIHIVLPDGRVLRVGRWLESLPPIPSRLTVVVGQTYG